VCIASKRGELMDQVASECNGGMLAVMFVPLRDVELILTEFAAPEEIVFANDNASDQVVLSGDLEYLDKFAAIISERKLGKCKRVQVVGPWHSPFMSNARSEFEVWAEAIPFKTPRVSLIMNATSKTEDDPSG
jgi:malonyl CoA-acyl carrier protein transacylase